MPAVPTPLVSTKERSLKVVVQLHTLHTSKVLLLHNPFLKGVNQRYRVLRPEHSKLKTYYCYSLVFKNIFVGKSQNKKEQIIFIT